MAKYGAPKATGGSGRRGPTYGGGGMSTPPSTAGTRQKTTILTQTGRSTPGGKTVVRRSPTRKFR